MDTDEKFLSPVVLWAQRDDLITLRVQIWPDGKPDCTVKEKSISFKCQGTGASGRNTYSFLLELYDVINTENFRVKSSAKEVEFQLMKKEAKEWPRLQLAKVRPPWLRLDFDRWNTGSSEEEVDEEKAKKLLKEEHQKKQIEAIEKELEKFNTYMKWADKVRKVYLVCYNAVQWVGFCAVIWSLGKCLFEGYDGIQTTYERAGPIISLCQVLAFLEVIHAAVGLVKGAVIPTLMQVLGRALILFVVLGTNKQLHSHPVVWILFVLWSLIELIRYPYYALSVVDVQVGFLTWLRYTAWIPLYPLGICTEGLVVWLSIPGYYDNYAPYSFPLPNPLNISFHYATFLWVYLLLALPCK